MREPRIKIAAEEAAAVYHCISRTVNRERLFDDLAMEVFRRQLRQVAEFCGVEVLTYAILSNHFHVLVRVPRREPIDDVELLRRYAVLHPHSTPFQTARLEVIRAELEHNGPDAATWRKRQLALMNDLSQFMKLLKLRFSIWFNQTHDRVGTLWAERFKSVLVEGESRVLQTVAAYVDLNAVRAGLVSDPKDYRFCGYADAVGGNPAARRGLHAIAGGENWSEVQARYRETLFGAGAEPREAGASIPHNLLEQVLRQRGHLPLTVVLRCRLRHFADGAVLGSHAFVAAQLAAFRRRHNRIDRNAPWPLPPCTDWGGLATLRSLRGRI